MRRNLWVVVSLAALLLASPCAPGAVKNFITDGGTWNTAANWADSITGLPGVPGTNDDASFTASSGSSCVLNSGAALKGLAFTTSGGYALAYSGATQSLSIYGDGITVNPSTPSTITVNPGAAIGLGSATVLANQTWNIAAGSTLNLGTSGQNIFCYSGPTVQVTGGGTVNLLAFVPQDYSAKFQIDNSTLAFNGGTKASIIGGLSGSGTVSIPMAAAGQCVDVWASSDSTWTGAITGTAPFFKTGPGTFTVSGSGNIGLQTYLRGGTLDLDYTGANQTHLAGMTGSTGLTFVGGSLKVDGNASAPTSDSAGFLRVGGNSTYANYTSEISTINVVHGADQTATLTFSNTQAITTYAAQMIRFTGNDLGGTGTGYSRIMFGATGVNSQNGIIGGFASVTDPTGATEADFAKFDATLGVIALPAVGRAGDPNTAPNNSNVLMTVGTTLASVKQMNSLKLSGNIGLNLGGTSLKLVSGGIMQTGADNTTGITNGTIDCSNYGTPYSTLIYTEKDLLISATINGNSSGWFAKGGPGKLTFTGNLARNGSTTPANSLDSINSLAFFWEEGSLEYGGGQTLGGELPHRLETRLNNFVMSGTGTFDVITGFMNLTGTAEVKSGVLHLRPGVSMVAGGNWSSMNAGTMQVDANGLLWLDHSQNGYTSKYFGADTVTGTGTIMVNMQVSGTGTVCTMLATGVSFQPGYGMATPGVQTISGGLSLAVKGTQYASLVANLLNGASGAPAAGTDYSQLVVTGTVTNLPNANLVVHLASGQHWDGATVTILTAGGGFAGTGTKQFRSVTFDPYYSGTVNYGANAITLSNIVPLSGLAATPVSGGLISLGTNIASGTPVTDANAVSLASIGGSFSTLNITDVQVTGADAALFSAVLNGSGTGIAQGTNVYYDLAFAGTTAAGTYSASLLFTTDAGYGPSTASYSLEATVVAAADIPGDINRDNIVDQADYTVWYNHYGQTPATWTDGDVTGDNIVDQADYTVWYNNYGSTGGNVPEPMTMALLAIGGLAMLRRRK